MAKSGLFSTFPRPGTELTQVLPTTRLYTQPEAPLGHADLHYDGVIVCSWPSADTRHPAIPRQELLLLALTSKGNLGATTCFVEIPR